MSKFDHMLGEPIEPGHTQTQLSGLHVIEKPDQLFWDPFWGATFSTWLGHKDLESDRYLTHNLEDRFWTLAPEPGFDPAIGDCVMLTMIHQDERELKNHVITSVRREPMTGGLRISLAYVVDR